LKNINKKTFTLSLSLFRNSNELHVNPFFHSQSVKRALRPPSLPRITKRLLYFSSILLIALLATQPMKDRKNYFSPYFLLSHEN